MTDQPYEQWLAERREASPPATLADQIMSQVAELERLRRDIWWLRLVQRIEQSRAARWAVCGGALAIGCLPFVFLVRAAHLGSF
jgi:hypothetical protein